MVAWTTNCCASATSTTVANPADTSPSPGLRYPERPIAARSVFRDAAGADHGGSSVGMLPRQGLEHLLIRGQLGLLMMVLDRALGPDAGKIHELKGQGETGGPVRHIG